MATNSSVQPPAVTGHTLTNIDKKWLYLFGGKSQEISTLDTIYRIQIPGANQWEQVKIRGGNFPPRRLVGHSTVFHQESRSLIVFGGYSQKNGLVSERTRQMHMFNIDDGFWSVIHNKNWEEPSLPYQRAFHSAVIMGNYMVVYGGNTHKHHQLELSYWLMTNKTNGSLPHLVFFKRL
ncbi:hypothetical protein LOTGIDRAFT_174752 [Lottia gigantea]|uniref:Attractin/MKLN-like beta-propeller domain-containing protein n=1 Tax=Lottia gigantea TaxID=225164 RepID=V4C4Y4_LOTGI|nr:hypothetical protein LOTGIDRAFT_174752 [Lottia gigantea]ESO96649.1 hypothetical protein LOTGIDRAFT_174752 [Lottia gigantea]